MKENNAQVWEEIVSIPTYGIGEPEKSPMFLEKRVYQGSSGVVYPHAVVEKILDHKENKEWRAVYVENDYLKIMILPELGGRIQMAYDKTKERHFVYYNQVIKPALVGLTGPWISGGIEFNWPQHHRPSTYLPLEHQIESHDDGSVTVWCNEVERMFRTRALVGFTLHPDKAYLEIKAKLYNRTSEPQTFLWWANPAVHVNDHYQSVFPPDVNAVFDHGKRDVSRYPLATGIYYKCDYSSGVDISRYKNIPVPTSFMAVESKYNFVGGYENDTQGGLLHIADHHVSPGKKQWTWGNGDFGKAWDRNLTDEDGPYIELMCGVYTDNQPDFSWLMPYEEKEFTQYFMPYRDLGVIKNASKDVMLNLELIGEKASIKLYSTSILNDVEVSLLHRERRVWSQSISLSPLGSFEEEILIDPKDLSEEYLVVVTHKGAEILRYSPEPSGIKSIPDAATPALLPHETSSIEQLYLTGLHLEQYRHATYLPEDYYNEGLRREPNSIVHNNALGKLLLRKGQFAEAEKHLQRAIATWMERNPNPYDGESLYNLGVCLEYQNKIDNAFDAYFKATWNAAWQDSAYFGLARIALGRRQLQDALEYVERALKRNAVHHKARHLKAVVLRKLGREEEAKLWIDESLQLDAFNYGLYWEQRYWECCTKDLNELMINNIHNYIEYALDYIRMGCYDEAISWLDRGLSVCGDYPMVYYIQCWAKLLDQKQDEALMYARKGACCNSDYCFPNRLEEKIALTEVLKINPKDAKANYYLGNFWYANRQYDEAIDCWEKSVEQDNSFSIAVRNLAQVRYNKQQNSPEALVLMEQAYQLNPKDARILMEYDQLRKKLNHPFGERLELLLKEPSCYEYRDDLYLEIVTLLNQTDQHKEALNWIINRNFHPWEGGEGKVSEQYLIANRQLALAKMEAGDLSGAIDHLEAMTQYPSNLGEGKLSGALENDIHYYLGVVYARLGSTDKAQMYWKKAANGNFVLSDAMYYNDQQPHHLLYKGLAMLQLKEPKALGCFNQLIDHGEKHIYDKISIDYFAVSLPDIQIWEEDLDKRNQLHCKYLIAMGRIGKQEYEKAEALLKEILSERRDHSGAFYHLSILKNDLLEIA